MVQVTLCVLYYPFYFTLKNMYIIYKNVCSENLALFNIKNNKNSNHCVNNDFANAFLAAQMWSITFAGSPEF